MEDSNAAAQGPDARRWIGLIVIGLLLGETSLGLIAALTRDIVLPALAMAMGDTSSPLTLGKRDFDFPNLLSAILQFCLAAIVAIVVNAWTQKGTRAVRTRSLSLAQTPVTLAAPAPTVQAAPAPKNVPVAASPRAVTTAPSPPAPRSPVPSVIAAPPVTTPAAVPVAPQTASPPRQFIPAAASPTQPTPPAGSSTNPPKPQATPAPPSQPKPAKPKKPKEVYYNIVGERITPEDDDE